MDYVEMYAWLVILLTIVFLCGYQIGRQSAEPKRDARGRFTKGDK